MEFHPVSISDGYCNIRGGERFEYSVVRIRWHNTSYDMSVRDSAGFRKPGQRKASDYALCLNNPENSFRNFKEQSFTSLDGKIFYIRWDIAGKGDAWVSNDTTNEGYIRMRDMETFRGAGMLVTGGEVWLAEDERIPMISIDTLGNTQVMYK
ncbi:hypothetical protein DFQ28_001221 [Apophysomyces sp. BC1034]|nr:hypothetical protein DFQ28_001221 [Apophysomyces sp. BC1034]